MIIILHFYVIISLYFGNNNLGGCMIRGLIDLLELLFVWGFLYLGSIFILILGIVHLKSSQPIIQEQHYHQTTKVFASPKRVLVEREVCKDIRGCQIVKGKCIGCVIDSVWE